MHPFVAIAVLVLAVIANAAALYIGNERSNKLYNTATIFGGVGLFAFVGLAVAVLDAFTQIWVKRPGYEGQPVIFFLALLAVCAIGSAAAAGTIVFKERRAEA